VKTNTKTSSYKISKDVDKLTPSEQKRVDEINERDDVNILYITRARGGWLLIDIEYPNVRKTEKHEWPFRYKTRVYGKRGALLEIRSGNIYEDYDLVDNYSVTSFGSWRHHNKRI